MKYLLIILVALTFGLRTATAQDLLVTDNGDSINCKITRSDKNFIYFMFKYEGELRTTVIPVSKVTFSKKKFYRTPQVPAKYVTDVPIQEPDSHSYAMNIKLLDSTKLSYAPADTNYKRFRASIYGGLSQMTAKVAEELDEVNRQHLEKLQSGWHMGGEAAFYFSDQIGIGVHYTIFRSTEEEDIFAVNTQTGEIAKGKLSDDLTITFLAPTLYYGQTSENKKFRFELEVGLGPVTYTDVGALIDPFTIKSSTVGYSLGLALDYFFTSSLSAGAGISVMGASLSSATVTTNQTTRRFELDSDHQENISRIDYRLSLRLNL